MFVFGLVSTLKGAFGDDVNFVVVTKMAFILDASPSSALVLPSVMITRQDFMLQGDVAHPDATIALLSDDYDEGPGAVHCMR
jgi:hypothetical protein